MASKHEWWRGCVIYQIYPRSFQDDNGDGIGDLKGIARRLPYIADLGVDAIWLSPFFTSPMLDMGYDVSDHTGIDPLFGTLDDFDELVNAAHEAGLRVIIDQVLSHSSNLHPFFEESRQSRDNPKADWYVWADPKPDGTPPNNWLAIFNGGSAWEWEPRRQQFYFHNFLREQPDFNFHNPEVQDWALSVMKFWLDRNVDGFRLDTVNFYFHDDKLRDNPAEYRPLPSVVGRLYEMQFPLFSKNQPDNIAFLERMRGLLDQYGDRMLIGEIGDSHQGVGLMAEYTRDKRLHMAYSFDMLGPVFTAEHFRQQVEAFFAAAPNGWPCWAFSNHDVQRHVSRWGCRPELSDDLARMAGALLMSLPGSICIFQGEELGQTETELEYAELTDPQGLNYWPADKGRDGCRTPMAWQYDALNAGFSEARKTWLPVKEAQASKAVDLQDGAENSVLETYRALLKYRNASADLWTSICSFPDLGDAVLGIRRGGDTLCLFNLSDSSQSIVLPEQVHVDLDSKAKIAEDSAELGPFGWLIGRVKKRKTSTLEPVCNDLGNSGAICPLPSGEPQHAGRIMRLQAR